MTLSGDGGELYLPYDGDVNTHKWIGAPDPPQSIAFTLELDEVTSYDFYIVALDSCATQFM